MGRIFRFDDCVVDTRKRKLTRQGQPVDLQGQTWDLLVFLLEHPQVLVTKQELLDAVWRTPHLTDSTIAQAVMKVRKAIGDDGRQQRLIKTHHGRGFEFTGMVRVDDADSVHQPDSQLPARPRHIVTIVAIISTMSAVALMIWQGLDRDSYSPELAAEPESGLNGSMPAAQVTWLIGDFVNGTDDPALEWLGQGLSAALQSTLSRDQSISLLTVNDVEAIRSGPADSVTSMTGTDYRLTVELDREDKQYRLSYAIDIVADEKRDEGEITGPDPVILTRELIEICLSVSHQAPRPLVPGSTLFDIPLVAELYARSQHAMFQNRHDDAIRLLEAALTDAPDNIDILIALIDARHQGKNLDQAIIELKAVQQSHGDELTDRLGARLLHRMGDNYWYTGDIQASRQLLGEALALTDGFDDPVLKGLILNSLAAAIQSSGDLESGWSHAMLALEQFRQAGDNYHLSVVMTNLAYMADDFGRVVRSGKLHEDALAIREKYGFPELIAASRYGVGRIMRRSGRFDEAEPLLRQALETSTELELGYDMFDNMQELAELNIEMARFEEASDWITQAQQLAIEADDRLGQAWALEVIAMIDMARGQYQTASDSLFQAHEIFINLDEVQESQTVLYLWIRALLGNTRIAAATEKLALLESSQDGNVITNVSVKTGHARGWIHAAAGEQQLALDAFNKALSDARTTGAIDLEAHIALDMIPLLLQSGDHKQAELLLATAKGWRRDYYRTLQAEAQFCLMMQQSACAETAQAELSRLFPQLENAASGN